MVISNKGRLEIQHRLLLEERTLVSIVFVAVGLFVLILIRCVIYISWRRRDNTNRRQVHQARGVNSSNNQEEFHDNDVQVFATLNEEELNNDRKALILENIIHKVCHYIMSISLWKNSVSQHLFIKSYLLIFAHSVLNHDKFS